LPPAIHGDSYEKLDFCHFKRRCVSMSQQIADECSVVADLFCAFPITDTRGLYDAAVVAHHVDKTDKAIVQHWEFLPSQRVDLSKSFFGGLADFGNFGIFGHRWLNDRRQVAGDKMASRILGGTVR